MNALAETRRRTLRAAIVALVPPAAQLDEEGWREVDRVVGEGLDACEPALRAQFLLFLFVLRWLPVVRYGAAFEDLSPARRDAFLSFLEDCPLQLVRTGFWGLRTLAFMGYYGRPAAWERLAYRPCAEGNAMLHG